VYLEQETLLTLLQSTQLFKWGPGGLVSTGETAHPTVKSIGTWCKLGSKCPTVFVLLIGVGIAVEFKVP